MRRVCTSGSTRPTRPAVPCAEPCSRWIPVRGWSITSIIDGKRSTYIMHMHCHSSILYILSTSPAWTSTSQAVFYNVGRTACCVLRRIRSPNKRPRASGLARSLAHRSFFFFERFRFLVSSPGPLSDPSSSAERFCSSSSACCFNRACCICACDRVSDYAPGLI